MNDSKKLSTEAYKGVRDFYPEDQAVQNYIFKTWASFVEKCGYAEYNASILEPADLYRGKNAENEEIINEQTYTFTDRGDREVTLRPEMTPTVARMVAGKRRELGFPLRLYSIQNFFRYERPQKGRLREFWQLNVDLFGAESKAADTEIIAMAYGLMHAFGAKEGDFEIRVNSRQALNKLIQELGIEEVYDERARKLYRLLDAQKKMTEEEFAAGLREIDVAPEKLLSHEMPEDVAAVVDPLRNTGFMNVKYDPTVVRGFDYYTGVVFEVFDTNPENNRSLFGGGRYDNLLSLFGEEVPAVGFGMGDVTIRDFLQSRNLIPEYVPATHVYIAVPSPEFALSAQTFAGELRRDGVNVAIDFGEKKLGDQIKTADKHKIPYVIVLGSDEIESKEVIVRELKTGEEKKMPIHKLAEFFLKR
jgi:histidyl-tRNA synthetase